MIKVYWQYLIVVSCGYCICLISWENTKFCSHFKNSIEGSSCSWDRKCCRISWALMNTYLRRYLVSCCDSLGLCQLFGDNILSVGFYGMVFTYLFRKTYIQDTFSVKKKSQATNSRSNSCLFPKIELNTCNELSNLKE